MAVAATSSADEGDGAAVAAKGLDHGGDKATASDASGSPIDRTSARRPSGLPGGSAAQPRRGTRRCRNGVRKRSQATRRPRRGPGCIREPCLSDQRDGDDRDPVAATAGEVDQLDVEDDAGDPLPGEEVVGRLAGEALEPALGVLDVTDGPDRGQGVERPARGGGGSPAGCAACRCRRAGSGCRGRGRGRGAPRRGAAAGRAGWPCPRRRRWRGRSRRPASRPSPRRPCRRGGPPGAPGAARRRPWSPPSPGEPGPGRRSRRCCRRRPPGRGRRPAGAPRPARRRDPARRAGAGSRTARRGPAPGAPPRCRRAGRSVRLVAVIERSLPAALTGDAPAVPTRQDVFDVLGAALLRASGDGGCESRVVQGPRAEDLTPSVHDEQPSCRPASCSSHLVQPTGTRGRAR